MIIPNVGKDVWNNRDTQIMVGKKKLIKPRFN